LHLKGIGGIGKSSLLNHWVNTHEKTIRLDCEQYTEFYQRLNILAKGAVQLGVKLDRFDILWQIRQRFVEGVEPVKEEGRQWAKEVVMAIPFIGSLASIGSAINAVSSQVAPKLKGKYSTVGKWLQETLGKNHIEQLLNILWKDPSRAEFLYLEAFLEDINNRSDSNAPILFLLDHFEYVDDTKAQWKYQRTKINETQLWTIFLCNLANCVGVLASRRAASVSKLINVEESELLELDKDSCFEMLELQDTTDKQLQERIVSVSGGNPFVIDAICDMINTSEVSISDIEGLRADTLAEVRLRVWRRLFSQAKGLQSLINRAGILPYFDERIMRVIAPEMTLDGWDRLRSLSFTKLRSDGSFVLHDLAEDLVRAELGDNLGNLVDEVSDLLEKKCNEEGDFRLLGLAVSVQALASEKEAMARAASIVFDLLWNLAYSDTLVFLDAVAITTREGYAIVQGLRGDVLTWLNRLADGEHSLLTAIEIFGESGEKIPDELLVHEAQTLRAYGGLLNRTQRTSEAIDTLQKSVNIYKKLDEKTLSFRIEYMARAVLWLGVFLIQVSRLEEAEMAIREAYELFERSKATASYIPARGIIPSLRFLSMVQVFVGKVSEAEENLRAGLEFSRTISKERPEFEVSVAMYCKDLGELMSRKGRPYEAIDLIREANQLTSEFDKKEPEAWREPLLIGLITLALTLSNIGRLDEAEEKYREALVMSRKLAEEIPDVFLPFLASTLCDYAVLLKRTNLASEAEGSCREALSIHRELVANSPGVYLMPMAWNLNNFAVILRQTGRISEAQEAYQESLDIARGIAFEAPEAVYLTDLLATILNNFAVLLRHTGEISEAKKYIQEALELRKQLAQKSPELFLHRVATTLNNLGILLFETGKISEAEDAFREALELRRELAKKSPELYQSSVMMTLSNLAILLKQTDHTSNAKDLYQEAIKIGEDLVLQSPMAHQHELTRTLCNYAHLLSDIDSRDLLQKTMARLNMLGIEVLPASEEWSEEEELEVDPLKVM
ncbi:MAG: tetratricopeptide repeat protein, partial [Promethearchaeota archaeon]